MRTINIVLGDLGAPLVSIVLIQKREGDRWRVREAHVARSNAASSRRTVLLEDDERIVIEPMIQMVAAADATQNMVKLVPKEITDLEAEAYAKALVGVVAGPLPPGTESQIGVWREADEQEWSRTGKRYRTY